ncbi:MAG: hypothetical protein V1934_07200 [Methanobacteriota archaeon]
MSAVIFALSKNPRPGVNLVVEDYPGQSQEIFGSLVSIGTRGLYISEERQPQHHIKPSDTRVRYLWFSKMGLSPGDDAGAIVAEIGNRIRSFIEESGCSVVMVDAIPRLLRRGGLASLGTLFEAVSAYSEKRGVPIIIPVAIPPQARNPEARAEMPSHGKPSRPSKAVKDAERTAAPDGSERASCFRPAALPFANCERWEGLIGLEASKCPRGDEKSLHSRRAPVQTHREASAIMASLSCHVCGGDIGGDMRRCSVCGSRAISAIVRKTKSPFCS